MMSTTRDNTINYRDCPIDIDHTQRTQRVTILDPVPTGNAFRVIAVTDRDGTFPAPPRTFYYPKGMDGDHWIINGTYDACPPSRTDTLMALLRRLPRKEMLRFGRWCRAYTIEYSFIAAARSKVWFPRPLFPEGTSRIAEWAIKNAVDARRGSDAALAFNVLEVAICAYNARHAASNPPMLSSLRVRRRRRTFHHAWMNVHDELLARVLRHEGGR